MVIYRSVLSDTFVMCILSVLMTLVICFVISNNAFITACMVTNENKLFNDILLRFVATVSLWLSPTHVMSFR